MGMKEYVLGTRDDELERLGLQHRLWAASAHRIWEDAGFRRGMRLLDVGCGPGYATAELAQVVTHDGHVTGVDESARFLDRARTSCAARGIGHVTFLKGDVHDLDDLEEGSFDGAYCRWVLCFVSDPVAVLRRVRSLLKPGGRFAIQDYFNYEVMTLAPRRPEMDLVAKAAGRSFRDRGGDQDVMGRILPMAREAGFEVHTLRVNQRIARPTDTLWAWPDSFWRIFAPKLRDDGYLTDTQLHDFFAMWEEVSASPDTFMVMPTVFDFIGVRRG
ncbi:MAG: methyltransferase domain-containing protein [Phycisphaerales bacterium]|nr:methyltransferase domain-containing protein [Phycisphaerales bacterium]